MTTHKTNEELWDKYSLTGDENNPDRMFYEGFMDAMQSKEAEVERVREEERERVKEIVKHTEGFMAHELSTGVIDERLELARTKLKVELLKALNPPTET